MSSGVPILLGNALCSFISHVHKEVGEFFALHLKPWKSDDHEQGSQLTIWSNSKSPGSRLSLERQMKAWKDNPFWVDHPPDIKVMNLLEQSELPCFCSPLKITVTIPKGSLSYLSLTVDVGLPPDAVYDIVTDPENKRVFKNIKEVISRKVLVDEGSRQIVEVEQAAIWRFLWLSGTISIHVLVDQNRENYTMKFKQIKSGFMEKFEGYWKMEPLFVDEDLCYPCKPKSLTEYVSCTEGRGRIGSKLSLQQLIQPAIVPPPPISLYLRGITTKTTEMLISDLLAEAARIRLASTTGNLQLPDEKSSEGQACEGCDIKQRWAMRRRRIAKRSDRRLFLNSKPY